MSLDNEMFHNLRNLYAGLIEQLERIDKRLRIIEGQIYNLKPHPQGIDIIYFGDKGEQMADLVLQQGESKTAMLIYKAADGSSMGQVPASDSPAFTADSVDLSISMNPDGTAVISNNNTGSGDVDVQLTGTSNKGFSVVKTVTTVGVVAPPPVQPAGVDILFQ